MPSAQENRHRLIARLDRFSVQLKPVNFAAPGNCLDCLRSNGDG
jgi:hypothetical protein